MINNTDMETSLELVELRARIERLERTVVNLDTKLNGEVLSAHATTRVWINHGLDRFGTLERSTRQLITKLEGELLSNRATVHIALNALQTNAWVDREIAQIKQSLAATRYPEQGNNVQKAWSRAWELIKLAAVLFVAIRLIHWAWYQ
jgi:hypothetical protein